MAYSDRREDPENNASPSQRDVPSLRKAKDVFPVLLLQRGNEAWIIRAILPLLSHEASRFTPDRPTRCSLALR